MAANIPPPDKAALLAPFLPALPPATISTQPAIGILPLLSPILRQRVNLLSANSAEPWLRLLCYDTDKAAKLAELVRTSGNLEPHPVSGEVEVDWEYDAESRFRRVDEETLQALVVLEELGLAFKLIYCVNDQEGGGDGWRVGEVSMAEKPSPFADFGGVSNIAEAERQFKESKSNSNANKVNGTTSGNHLSVHQSSSYHAGAEEQDDDDDYWARYDATPARTPAQKRSPAPPSVAASQLGEIRAPSADDDYFAQYDDVQPAMDNHDPDEEAAVASIMPPLGLGRVVSNNDASSTEVNETQGTWTLAELEAKTDSNHEQDGEHILHPRPASSAANSSNGSQTVAKLEHMVEKQDQSDFGVKQHVSRSIRSLFLLSRSSGIDREEFERLVRTELDVLGMVGEDQ